VLERKPEGPEHKALWEKACRRRFVVRCSVPGGVERPRTKCRSEIVRLGQLSFLPCRIRDILRVNLAEFK
jgi:hypothetical protein